MNKLKKHEKEILKKYENSEYTSEDEYKNDIVKFLKNLENQESNIKTNEEFAWVLDAITRWSHYLSMRFNILIQIESPNLDHITIEKEGHNTNRNEEQEGLGKSLVSLLNRFEKMDQSINQEFNNIKSELKYHDHKMSMQHITILDDQGEPYSSPSRSKIRKSAHREAISMPGIKMINECEEPAYFGRMSMQYLLGEMSLSDKKMLNEYGEPTYPHIKKST